MGHRSAEQPPDDRGPAVDRFQAALLELTGSRHPIHTDLGPLYQSIAIGLFPTAVHGCMDAAMDALAAGREELAELPDPLVTSEISTATLVAWADAAYGLNRVGVLDRLYGNRKIGELADAVHLTVHQVLQTVVERKHWSLPADKRSDVHAQLLHNHLATWLARYDPAVGSLKTYLYGQLKPKALSREDRVNLGLEGEDRARHFERPPTAEHDDIIASRVDLQRCPEASDPMVVARYVDDRPTDEIAAQHSMSPGAARGRMRRKLDKLREMLGPNS